MSKLSILRFGLLQSLVLIVLAGLVTVSIYLTRSPSADESGDLPTKPVMAAQIEFMAETMRRTAERIAAHPQTLACFQTAATDICQKQAANLYVLNQDATVLFVTPGAEGSRQLLPGFLPGETQRLINSPAGSNSSTASATFNLSLSHPVINALGQRLGFVIVEQSIPQLQMLFDKIGRAHV